SSRLAPGGRRETSAPVPKHQQRWFGGSKMPLSTPPENRHGSFASKRVRSRAETRRSHASAQVQSQNQGAPGRARTRHAPLPHRFGSRALQAAFGQKARRGVQTAGAYRSALH